MLVKLKSSTMMVLFSEDTQRRQRVLQCWRHTAVWQVQVAQTLHESMRCYAKLSGRRLQSLATQVLPAFQSDCV